MAIETVKEFFKQFGRQQDILEMDTSTATVQLAAEALGTIPARIAKSMAVKGTDGTTLVLVVAGDARLDNRKFKDTFATKVKMLSPEETLQATGHEVGGVCPFALPNGVVAVLDKSLKRFETVFPACGNANSAIELTMEQLEKYTSGTWVDVCKEWE